MYIFNAKYTLLKHDNNKSYNVCKEDCDKVKSIWLSYFVVNAIKLK